MKAVYINDYGTAEQLTVGELNTPEITGSQVLINVIAAGVNPVDFHVRNGMLKDSDTHTLPLIVGWDAAGIVAEIGVDVTNINVGDEVFVFSPINQQGTYAEYLAVDANLVTAKPSSLNFVESAAVPLAALTAWQGLFRDGNLKAGERVLIHNASGGVGSFAVQFAKHAGAHVIATASGQKEQYVNALGADEFVDYTESPFEDNIHDIDLVFAAVGGNDILPRSLKTLNKGGRLISTFDEIPHQQAEDAGATFIRMWVEPSAEDLAGIGELIDQNKIHVFLDSVYPLEHAKHAQERSESGKAVGKIVLNINPAVIG
ncbi:Zn-dependent oxidoreductase [Gammaproteobacteria bacterium 45_16_T64]|nr:Zn-dependent oxidoreductase [Gammaproteobacteria bacterium 45_16_T64]